MIGNDSREGAELTAQDEATTVIAPQLLVNLVRLPTVRMMPPRDSDDFTLVDTGPSGSMMKLPALIWPQNRETFN